MQTAKLAVTQSIEQACWDETIMYEFYVKQKIEKGFKTVEDVSYSFS